MTNVKENEILNSNIPAAVKLVIREYEKEKEEARKKRIYHNTYMLMKKYNVLKSHIEDMKEDIDIELEMHDLEAGDVWILSVAKSKVKSIKMIGYIDNALEIVAEKFRKKGAINEFVAFKMFFIEEKTNEEIMKKLSCGKNSPKKWSDNLVNELSILLWGYEALGIQ